MSEEPSMESWLLGLVGAAIGGWLGYLAFFWIASQGFYALPVPGAVLGIGCGLLAQRRIMVLAIICGLAALSLGLFTEWRFRPFIADKSLSYFLGHLYELKPSTLLMIALGGVFGFWFGLGLKGKAKSE